jgi:Ca2+-binding RTX toxin-like protein
MVEPIKWKLVIVSDGIVNTTQTINIITGNNLNGTSASEVLIGGTGDDTINGGSGHDKI